MEIKFIFWKNNLRGAKAAKDDQCESETSKPTMKPEQSKIML